MKNKRFILIGIAPAVIEKSIQNLKDLNFEVIILENKSDIENNYQLIKNADRIIDVDINQYETIKEVVFKLNKENKIVGIFSFREFALLNTAKLIEELKLYGNNVSAVESCIDKFKTRTLLKEAGLLGPKFTIFDTMQNVNKFLDNIEGEVIIKPNNLAGSMGITKVKQKKDVPIILNNIKKKYPNSTIMLEEFIRGKEISIEAIIYRGDVHILGITEKLLYEGTFIESGHISPYMGNEMSITQYKELVAKVVTAMGITFGPLHIEGFHTNKGFIVGDVHTRYGGDNIPIITELASGYDMTFPIFAELSGEKYEITQKWNKFACIKFLNITPGTITKIIGVNKLKNMDGIIDININCSIGDKISKVKSNSDRHGWIIAQGNSRQELENILENALKTLKIITE